MRRFMLIAALCAALVLAMAPAVMAQSRGPSGADGTFNCEDFDTQEQAQAFFNSDPGDTNGLDGPPGDAFTGRPGVACEGLPSSGMGTMEEPVEPPVEMIQPTTPTQYGQPETPNTGVTPDAIPTPATPETPNTGVTPDAIPTPATPETASTTALPATGGPSLALLAGTFLLGAGLILRRR